MLELSDFCGLLVGISINEACGTDPSELLSKLNEHTLQRAARRAVTAYYGTEDPSLPEIQKMVIALAQLARNKAKA